MERKDTKNLKERYLVWFYKVTKEALDRIERKFTQSEIDRFILHELKSLDKFKRIQRFIEEFELYIRNKEKEGIALKYGNKDVKPEYYFLVLKLKAIEKAIINEFGKKKLKKIQELYQEEMIGRILKEREHRT